MTTTTVPTVAERPYSETAYANTKLAILACNTTLPVAEKTTDVLLRALARHADEFFPGRPALPAEAFTDPARLVDLLADSAEHHGWTVDRSDETRRALLHTARTLQYLLIPGGAR